VRYASLLIYSGARDMADINATVRHGEWYYTLFWRRHAAMRVLIGFFYAIECCWHAMPVDILRASG